MFYSETILSKKGPLAKIWLAAHWEKKLSKSQFLQTNIKQSVNAIVNQNQVPIALRLSGQLLLGVVKVYSRKARYLLEDCNEALMKIKITFRSENLDLPISNNVNIAFQSAQLALPETITEFDLLVPDPSFNIIGVDEKQQNLSFPHVSKKQDITLISAFESSIEVGRGYQLSLEDDPLIHIDDNGGIDLDLGIDDTEDLRNDDVSIELGRDHVSNSHFSQEFSNIIGSENDKDINIPETAVEMVDNLNVIESNDIHDLLEIVPDVSFQQPTMIDQDNILVSDIIEESIENNNDTLRGEILDFDELQVGTPKSQDKIVQSEIRRSRYKKAIEDPVIEISSKEFSFQLRNTSSITKRNKLLSSNSTFLTLFQLQTSGKFAEHVFQPSDIHPSIASLLNPGFVSFVHPGSSKRKRMENVDQNDDKSINMSKHLKTDSYNDKEYNLDNNSFSSNIENFGFENADNTLPPVDDTLISICDDSESKLIEASKLSMNNFISKQNEEIELENENAFEIDFYDNSLDLISILRNIFNMKNGIPKNIISFKSLTKNASRIDVSKKFFEILVLTTKNVINVEQKENYGDIEIKMSEKLFNNDIKIIFEKNGNMENHLKDIHNVEFLNV